MAVQLDREELVRLARLGAEARLGALEAERAQILRSFPELANRARGADAGGRRAEGAPARGRRRQMSAAERKAVSVRMKKYWAARRKQA
jgi:hypothetical protein